MVWQEILKRLGRPNLGRPNHRSTRKLNQRRLRLERMERRELLASDLGVIAGTTFVDQGNDGSPAGDPPVLVNASGDLVAPGTAGAMGIQVQLFNDDGTTPGVLDGNDTLEGTALTDLQGRYRFDGLSPGDYFVQQADVNGLTAPEPVLASVVDDDGVRTALIDDFSVTPLTILANGANPNQFQSVNATEAIGGNRDVSVDLTSGGSLLFDVIPATNQLTVSTGGDGVGTAVVQYDGSESTAALDPVGLRTGGVGVSLGGGARLEDVDPAAGLIALLRAENAGDQVTITIFSDGGNSSSTTLSIPQDAAAFQELYIPFSNFTVDSGSGADFNDVGAITTSVPITVANNDVFVSIVEAITPAIVMVDLPNIQTVTLGGTIFSDSSENGQNDGIRQGSEAGLAGVTVQLFQLADPDGTVDPAVDTPVAMTSTIAGGVYNFPGLIPGNYAVVIPAGQFAVGAPLFGFANSTGNDPLSDPDNNADDEDSGTVLDSGDVISGTITLESNLEPDDDDDTDANTNTTLDFGFFPQIDLSITKTVVPAGSVIAAGGNVIFDIMVQNTGPLAATNVVVTDTFPAGLTFTGLANQGGLVANVNGTTVTVDLGTVAAGTTQTFQFTADIADDQTVDLTNTATVAGTEVETDDTNNSDDELVDVISTDLRIAKTDLTDPVNAGNQFTYQITVDNDGPDDAAGVVVVDPLPPGVTFVSGNVDGAADQVTFDQTSGEVTATIGTLANQAQSVITLVVQVTPDAASPLNNTASVSADPNTDPDLTNNTTTEDTTVNRVVDVGVTKTVTGTAVAGRTVTYTVAVVNEGPGQARGVTVVDTLDADLTFVDASFDAGTSGVTLTQDGQTLTFDVGTLDVDQSETFTFDVMIAADAFGAIPNVATITTTDTDANADNDDDNADIDVTREVDLVLDKSVDLATATPGQDQLVYTFTVSHDTDSVSDAVGVTVTDTLPAGLSGVVISAPTATDTDFTGGVITVNFDSLPVGETRTFTVTADVQSSAVGDASGNIVNPATVASTGATELDTANNTDSATTAISPEFDIEVEKTVDNATPAIGGTVVYTVGLENEGPSDASGIILTDTIPAGLTLVSSSIVVGTGASQNGVVSGSNVSFPAVALASGGTATATLTFTVASTASGTITNTASIPDLSGDGENDITNNSDTAQVTVTPRAELTIAKTVSDTTAAAGDQLTYTVTVTNAGPSPAAGVVITDTLPSGVTFDSGTDEDGNTLTATGGVITVAGGTIAANDTFTFTILATIDAGVSASQTNSATVTTTTNENNPNDNTATVVTTVDPITSSIAGSVYLDANGNGVRDNGETGIPNVPITLAGTDDLGNVVDRTMNTDANGNYSFANLAAGTYTVTEDDPDAFDDGQEQAGTGAISSNTANDMFTITIGPGSGTNADATGFNFGELTIDEPVSKRRFLASSQDN